MPVLKIENIAVLKEEAIPAMNEKTMTNQRPTPANSATLNRALKIPKFFKQPDIAWLAIILGIGLVLRVYFLSQPMRYDESFSFMIFADRSWKDVFFYSCLITMCCIHCLSA